MLWQARRGLIVPRGAYCPAAGATPFGLDGTPQTANSGGTTALVLPGLSSTYANGVCVVAIITNSSGVNSVVSAHMTFARIPGLSSPGAGTGGSNLDLWYSSVVSGSPLSSEVITVNQGSSAFVTALAFSISGAKTSAPFDVNAAIPDIQSATGVSAKITTTASDVFGFGIDADTTSTPAAGFTDMSATSRGNFLQLNYKLSSTGFSAQQFSSNTAQAGSIATAIVKGP